MASESTKERKQTMVMGFWMDGVTSFEGLAASKNSVGNTVNDVAKLVINKINTNFELDPPLALNDNDMRIAWIPRKYEYCNILFTQLTIALYMKVLMLIPTSLHLTIRVSSQSSNLVISKLY